MISDAMFKANDIRGVVVGDDAEWDAEGAYAIGAAFVDTLSLADQSFVLGRDMRQSGDELSEAFAAGAADRGAHPVMVGLTSTDQLWFASGLLHMPGVQFTASHNPAVYNGIKFCLEDAKPVTSDMLREIKRRASEPVERVSARGMISSRDVLQAYADHLLGLVDTTGMRRLKVVVDAGNGMAGHTTPAVLGRLPVDVIGLFMELDGTFPNHQPNPLEPKNLVDAQEAVVREAADLALVFDGDADRCFIIDERGEVVSPSAITALIAQQELRRHPGATIVVNTITSRTVAEVVAENGGQTKISKVGHTYVKALMAQFGAVFGGEHSAHYYFRDFWGADTGMLAGLHVLALLGQRDQPLSALVAEFDRYHGSGEINSTVDDAPAMMRRVADAFTERGEHDWADGLLISGSDWWVSLRPSNTEPLLRLNVEAKDAAMMASLRDEVLGLIAAG